MKATRRAASGIIYYGNRRSSQPAGADESLRIAEVGDTRLDAIFCSCDADGCGMSWVSVHFEIEDGRTIVVANAAGGGCGSCGKVFCREHVSLDFGGIYTCPRCGGGLETPAPNGRQSLQIERVNKPLAHIAVVVKGRTVPKGDFVQSLCDRLMPDVYEDGPTISTFSTRQWTGDQETQALFAEAKKHPHFLTDDYEGRTARQVPAWRS